MSDLPLHPGYKVSSISNLALPVQHQFGAWSIRLLSEKDIIHSNLWLDYSTLAPFSIISMYISSVLLLTEISRNRPDIQSSGGNVLPQHHHAAPGGFQQGGAQTYK